MQPVVMTKSIDLEKGGNERHICFNAGESLPFRPCGFLGDGALGHVDKVFSLLSSKEYARKRIQRGRLCGRAREHMKVYETELAVLKRVKHHHIVELIGSYTDPRYLGLIISPVADSDLSTLFTSVPLSPDQTSFARSFFGCLSAALAYLHDLKIRHKDIKPQNILIKGQNVLLTDFGISFGWSELSRGTTENEGPNTPRYCSPEAANCEPRNSSSDIWSLGCVFLELVTILKGKTIGSMKEFFATHGSRSQFFRSNPGAIKE